MSTVQDQNTPSPKKTRQLSETALRELIRPHVPHAIEKLVELIDTADNDSVRVGAIKVLLSKVIPDLKSNDFQGEGVKQLAGLLTVIAERNQAVKLAEPSSL